MKHVKGVVASSHTGLHGGQDVVGLAAETEIATNKMRYIAT